MSIQATAAPPTFVDVTIKAGQSLSDWATIEGKLCGIYVPEGWTPASMTFVVSQEGKGNGMPLYEWAAEREYPSAVAVAGRALSLSLVDWLPWNAVRVRSGTSGVPITQPADRVIRLMLAG